MTAYVYLVRCQDGSLYTGWTNNLENRILAHNQGCGAKYTRGRGPINLVYYEIFASKQAAQAREYAIKRWTKKEKEALVESYAKQE